MSVYYFIISISLFFAFLNIDKRIVNSKKDIFVAASIVSLILIIIASIRYETGYDLNLYKIIFENTPTFYELISKKNNPPMEFELGYTSLYIFTKSIFNSFQFQLLVFSILSITLLQNITLKQSPYPLMSIFLYICFFYFFMIMGQMRQGLSIIILYYSYQYILKNNFKKFILIVCIASLFHLSSLIFLPSYFLVRKKYKIKQLFLIFIFTFIFTFFLIDYVILFFQGLYFKNPSNFLYYKIYVYSVHYVGDFSPMAYYEKIILGLVIILLYHNKNINQKIPNYHVISNIMLLGIIIYMCLIQTFTVIGARGANNFLSFSIFIYPMFLKSVKNVNYKYLIFLLIMIYPLVRCLMKLSTEYSYFPFKTFF